MYKKFENATNLVMNVADFFLRLVWWTLVEDILNTIRKVRAADFKIKIGQLIYVTNIKTRRKFELFSGPRKSNK